jgi:hypothetical protein
MNGWLSLSTRFKSYFAHADRVKVPQEDLDPANKKQTELAV